MKWIISSPKKADAIRVKVFNFYHYGVYLSEEEVISFGPNPSIKTNEEFKVMSSTLDDFLQGGLLEVGVLSTFEKLKANKKKKIEILSKQALGRTGYDIIHNNCEHFIYECILNKHYCSQTDSIRDLFKKTSKLDLYISKIPKNPTITTVYPKERNDEILKCSNESVKLERYYVWKLLEYAIEKSLNKKISDFSFKKTENGKWITNGFNFSLSHSDNVVVCAISYNTVGIDIERIKKPLFPIENKILSKEELNEFNSLKESKKVSYLIKKWTEKESEFKRNDESIFSPSKIISENCSSFKIKIRHKAYYLSISSKDKKQLKIYNVNIKKKSN